MTAEAPTPVPPQRARPPAAVVLAVAFLAGSVPFDNVAAHLVAHSDLRRVGSGTVSGTSLYEVTGFGPLAVAGCASLAKGAAGPLLAGPDRKCLGALAAGASVIGHDWSPWLGGAGGRGIAPSLGAMAVLAPEGVAVLGAGLGLGRLVHNTALVSLFSALTLFPLLARRGRAGTLLAASLVGPMVVKRLFGNDGRLPRNPGRLFGRLAFDRDPT